MKLRRGTDLSSSSSNVYTKPPSEAGSRRETLSQSGPADIDEGAEGAEQSTSVPAEAAVEQPPAPREPKHTFSNKQELDSILALGLGRQNQPGLQKGVLKHAQTLPRKMKPPDQAAQPHPQVPQAPHRQQPGGQQPQQPQQQQTSPRAQPVQGQPGQQQAQWHAPQSKPPLAHAQSATLPRNMGGKSRHELVPAVPDPHVAAQPPAPTSRPSGYATLGRKTKRSEETATTMDTNPPPAAAPGEKTGYLTLRESALRRVWKTRYFRLGNGSLRVSFFFSFSLSFEFFCLFQAT